MAKKILAKSGDAAFQYEIMKDELLEILASVRSLLSLLLEAMGLAPDDIPKHCTQIVHEHSTYTGASSIDINLTVRRSFRSEPCVDCKYKVRGSFILAGTSQYCTRSTRIISQLLRRQVAIFSASGSP